MALALSANKKHLAVAEHGEKVSVSIYDLQTLKRRKVLVSADPGTKVSRLHQQGPLCTCRHRPFTPTHEPPPAANVSTRAGCWLYSRSPLCSGGCRAYCLLQVQGWELRHLLEMRAPSA